MALLRKIDCVMVRVDDLDAARKFYEEVLGLTPSGQTNNRLHSACPKARRKLCFTIIRISRAIAASTIW
jgi:catechol 2,3-dioxygenase-like lactoylglutathione lyase family enzyme